MEWAFGPKGNGNGNDNGSGNDNGNNKSKCGDSSPFATLRVRMTERLDHGTDSDDGTD
jgi:hypothetical protein